MTNQTFDTTQQTDRAGEFQPILPEQADPRTREMILASYEKIIPSLIDDYEYFVSKNNLSRDLASQRNAPGISSIIKYFQKMLDFDTEGGHAGVLLGKIEVEIGKNRPLLKPVHSELSRLLAEKIDKRHREGHEMLMGNLRQRFPDGKLLATKPAVKTPTIPQVQVPSVKPIQTDTPLAKFDEAGQAAQPPKAPKPAAEVSDDEGFPYGNLDTIDNAVPAISSSEGVAAAPLAEPAVVNAEPAGDPSTHLKPEAEVIARTKAIIAGLTQGGEFKEADDTMRLKFGQEALTRASQPESMGVEMDDERFAWLVKVDSDETGPLTFHFLEPSADDKTNPEPFNLDWDSLRERGVAWYVKEQVASSKEQVARDKGIGTSSKEPNSASGVYPVPNKELGEQIAGREGASTEKPEAGKPQINAENQPQGMLGTIGGWFGVKPKAVKTSADYAKANDDYYKKAA